VHLVTGAALALTAVGLMAVVVMLWGAAFASLIQGPTGNWYLPPTYVVVAVVGPVPLLWLSRQFGDEQRSRFRRLLHVDIPAPPRPAGRWTPWRPWLSGATWRQLGYHLVACVLLPVAVLGLPFGSFEDPSGRTPRSPGDCSARAWPNNSPYGWRRWRAAGPT
jgi:hypothetical protein